ncbi:MAG: 1-aminocyclopropane-1-carboxylate deaminase/D-cysteine desulfhydrase [Bacteroidetes bacterium]|nr:1-aminocyclopropane-1-carboxylate deaminase/D-cysteine desulfhydrase [Bacteroidota bacterium]
MEIPLQKISNPAIEKSGINLFILRLDKIHPTISGNKWYKLKYNLEEAKRQKKDTLLTFGGAYSNHITATAAAGKEFGFKTIGIIRGDELASPNPSEGGEKNQTLKFAEDCGMKLIFVSREEYKNKNSSELIHSITSSLTNFYLLPEGGTNSLAVKGCSEIISHVNIPFDFVCCPIGTGGTIAGVISSLRKDQKAIGFSVLKDGGFLKNEIEKLLTSPLPPSKGEINTSYHFGGYAKHTPELLKFISDFEKENNIPLEQVYTGKMMFGIYDLIKKNYFPKNSTVIAIHTGGLQGKLPQL